MKVIQKQRITLAKQKPYTETLDLKLEQLAKFFQTGKSKEAFNLIKRLTILNPGKRDGGFFRCYKDEVGELQCGEQCLTNCYKQLGIISKIAPYQPQPLPPLTPLSQIEVQELQKMMSKDKAITRDGISDTFIKQTKNFRLLQDLWNNSTLETNIYLGEARLIPLNKNFPDIPNYNQFRPIVVLSPLFKFLELRFARKLQCHIENGLRFNQAGFCPGKGTQINIVQLIEQIQSTSKSDKLDAVFIDFSNAYNTVLRSKLYMILKEKNILNDIEVDFLIALHSQLHFRDPSNKKTKIWFENGVMQGSPISPSLFNIYLDEFLIEFSQSYNNWFDVKAYADDLVFITGHANITNFLNILQTVSSRWMLSVNKKKSGIFVLHNHLSSQLQSILDFPIVQKYNYLGISISNKSTVKEHITKIKSQLEAKVTKLKWICRKMPLYKMINIWKIYINSVINYAQPAVTASVFKTQKCEINKMRRTSLKQLIGLPNSASNIYTELIMKNRLNSRLPVGFSTIFRFGGHLCVKHQVRANSKHIIEKHLNLKEIQLIDYLRGSIKNSKTIREIKRKLKLLENLEIQTFKIKHQNRKP